ncbi:MAG: Lrp/AsnC family transcriptional regulator [Thermoplasmata archaeon]|nr:MAG: Lrp/AsnC family transcriptional regulator [Thermoplasmata archaeon]
MTVREGLDETDLKILDLLREDSRLSYREIGKRIHVSTGTVSDRVKHMLESGVIKRFTTAVDPTLMGLQVPMFLRVRVDPMVSIDAVVKRFEDVEEACCIHYVTGDLDMIVLVRCTDNDHAARVLDTIRTMKGVERVDSNVVLKAYPQCGRCWCDCGIHGGTD